MGGLQEASKSPRVMQSVHILRSQAENPDTARVSTCPRIGFSAQWPRKFGPRIETARFTPQERNTHTSALPCPTRPLLLRQQTLAALLRVRVAGPPPTPSPPRPGLGPCSAGSRRGLGGVSADEEQEAEEKTLRRPLVAAARRTRSPVSPGPQPDGGDNRAEATASGDPCSRGRPDLSDKLSFLQNGSALAVKPNFCKINKIDRDSGSGKRGRSALPP